MAKYSKYWTETKHHKMTGSEKRKIKKAIQEQGRQFAWKEFKREYPQIFGDKSKKGRYKMF